MLVRRGNQRELKPSQTQRSRTFRPDPELMANPADGREARETDQLALEATSIGAIATQAACSPPAARQRIKESELESLR
jgi:hypothetical protein